MASLTRLAVHAGSFSDSELAALNVEFEASPAVEVVAWAVEQFHPNLCLASSMTDAVLVDLAVRVEPSIEVVFIDTGFHFPETLETVERVRRRYDLNLRILKAGPYEGEPWKVDPEHCCSVAKTAQLDSHLAGKQAWMSGLRRAESPTRVAAPVVARDLRGLVKLNPIATWSDADVADYIADNDVPINPLLERGYRSIGCQPCTQPAVDDDPRSGRWPGRDKLECGIHL